MHVWSYEGEIEEVKKKKGSRFSSLSCQELWPPALTGLARDRGICPQFPLLKFFTLWWRNWEWLFNCLGQYRWGFPSFGVSVSTSRIHRNRRRQIDRRSQEASRVWWYVILSSAPLNISPSQLTRVESTMLLVCLQLHFSNTLVQRNPLLNDILEIRVSWVVWRVVN